MENNIKKIIISLTDLNIKGMIIVREKSIEKYGYDKEELNIKKIYSKAVLDLIKLNDNLKGETDDETVNNLYKEGLIEVTDRKVLTGIIIKDSDEFTVESNQGSQTFKSIDFYDEDDFFTEYQKYVDLLCKEYNLSYEELVSMNVIKDLSKNDYKDNDKESKFDENKYNEEYEENQESKINNFFIQNKTLLKRLLAGGVVLSLIGIGGCHILKHKGSKSNNSYESIEEVVLNPTITPSPIEKSKYIYIENEENILPYYQEPESTSVILKKINGEKSYSPFMYSMEDLFDIRNAEMSCVGNKVQSNISLEGDGTYIYFENICPNLADKDVAYIKYFSMIGNEIIKNSYQKNNYNGTLGVADYSGLSSYEVVRLIENDEPLYIYINGERNNVRFSELSSIAKKIVLNIAWTNTLPLYKQGVDYNNVIYTQDNISDIIINRYEDLDMIK